MLKSVSHPVDDSSLVREWGWKPKCDSFDEVIDVYLGDLEKNKIPRGKAIEVLQGIVYFRPKGRGIEPQPSRPPKRNAKVE